MTCVKVDHQHEVWEAAQVRQAHYVGIHNAVDCSACEGGFVVIPIPGEPSGQGGDVAGDFPEGLSAGSLMLRIFMNAGGV